MNNTYSIYPILQVLFFVFFLLWFIMHITDRRRMLNSLVFFFSGASLCALMFLVGTLQEIPALIITATVIGMTFAIFSGITYIGGIILLLVTGRKLIKREGFSLTHALSLILGIGIIISSSLWPILRDKIPSPIVVGIMEFFISVFIFYVFGFVLYVISSFLYKIWHEKRDKEFLIVLGAGLNGERVTPLLAARIDKAIEFYYSQKVKTGILPKIIMSGGQGGDEAVPEALAMKNYALERGIPEHDILMEDQSTNTMENLRFSTELINRRYENFTPKVLVFTSNFHVLRAGIIAKSMGLDYNAMGGRTKLYYYVSAIIREYIAVLKMHLKINILLSLIFGMLTIGAYIFDAYFSRFTG